MATANAASFTTFTVPGCGQTAAAAINDKNEVVGTTTCGGIATAFIRDAAGHFTTFTIDGAPTTATGINIHGAVIGAYSVDCTITPIPPCLAGYVRSPQGVITKINAPASPFVVPFAINASGQIAGNEPNFGVNLAAQGFFRDVDGTFIRLNFVEHGFKGEIVSGIDDARDISGGAFQFVSDIARAFIRAPDGTVNIVGPPNAGLPGDNWAIGIDRLGGHIVGYANIFDNFEITTRGFTQTATGAPKLFPVPFTSPNGILPFSALVSVGINSHGAAVSSPAFVASNGQSIYIAPDGTISTIELGPCQNAVATAINDNGWVTGSCGGDAFLWRK